MAFDYIVREIERLTQEEGYNDQEVADILGCSRATVNRNRLKNKIDKANLTNRKDKSYVCAECKRTIIIRRKERRKLLCPECFEQAKLLGE